MSLLSDIVDASLAEEQIYVNGRRASLRLASKTLTQTQTLSCRGLVDDQRETACSMQHGRFKVLRRLRSYVGSAHPFLFSFSFFIFILFFA